MQVKSKSWPGSVKLMKSICLAILNYNGRNHLEHLLPTACAAAKNFAGNCSVLVLDNRSTDPDVEWIKRKFPTVEVLIAPKNDFLFSYNWLAEKRTEDILVLLNNDLKLSPGFVQPLVRHFSFDDVFSVTATSRDWDDRIFTWGANHLKSHHGIYYWDCESSRQELSHTLFCSGGFMAVDRKKFLELDGFNRLFWPAYSEDLDLCFRAWRKGWRCIFEPKSIVLHRESGSWSVEGDNRTARLCLRTSLLFQWASLPPSVSRLESGAFVALTMWRKLCRAEFWWPRICISTFLEWNRQRSNYLGMMTSPAELEKIQARIAEPVITPAE